MTKPTSDDTIQKLDRPRRWKITLGILEKGATHTPQIAFFLPRDVCSMSSLYILVIPHAYKRTKDQEPDNDAKRPVDYRYTLLLLVPFLSPSLSLSHCCKLFY